MLNLFKKSNKKKVENDYLVKVAALLIHAAKIDQDFTYNENEIIKKTLIELGADISGLDDLINKANDYESNSNQILDFTKEIKNTSEVNKLKIIESLWKIIYSNKDVDMFESNLMRRLTGLLYIDNKMMGDIKQKIKKRFIK
jgi:uncharacterized tellurite resistance protein B-like protein